jgi:hypothetical protein
MKILSCAVVSIALMGCGSSLSGSYAAVAEANGTPSRVDPGYSVPEMNAKLAAEPRTIELGSDGKFKTTSGGKTVWEGKWWAEGSKVVLKTEVSGGNPLAASLQDEKSYEVKDGVILDDSTYSAYALRLAYKKK